MKGISHEISQEYTYTPSQAFKSYSDMVWKIAMARLKNTAASDDVLQEVFVRLIKANPKINSENHLKSWLIKVTVNCIKKYVTCSYIRHFTSVETDISDISINDSDIYLAVLSLAPKYRLAVHLYYYEGLSVSETAQALKISESAVKQRLSRARKKLKDYMDGDDLNV